MSKRVAFRGQSQLHIGYDDAWHCPPRAPARRKRQKGVWCSLTRQAAALCSIPDVSGRVSTRKVNFHAVNTGTPCARDLRVHVRSCNRPLSLVTSTTKTTSALGALRSLQNFRENKRWTNNRLAPAPRAQLFSYDSCQMTEEAAHFLWNEATLTATGSNAEIMPLQARILA